MSKIQFNDGIIIDSSCSPCVLRLKDGWYAVGEGMLIPCCDREEADYEVEMMLQEKK